MGTIAGIHSVAFSKLSDEQKSDGCAVCIEEFTVNDTTAFSVDCCKKVFHEACLNQWRTAQLKQRNPYNCPMCRHVFERVRPSLLQELLLEILGDADAPIGAAVQTAFCFGLAFLNVFSLACCASMALGFDSRYQDCFGEQIFSSNTTTCSLDQKLKCDKAEIDSFKITGLFTISFFLVSAARLLSKTNVLYPFNVETEILVKGSYYATTALVAAISVKPLLGV